MKITVKQEGGIWHGYLEGHPEVDERGLTEEVVRRKVEQLMARIALTEKLGAEAQRSQR